MIQLLCKENYLEYTGEGYFQCRRHVPCPKKDNKKILGFDCLLYIDNIPEGCKLVELETIKVDLQKEDIILKEIISDSGNGN